ncbi:MAG: exonuclease domain-containing protein [Lachnospira sp.]
MNYIVMDLEWNQSAEGRNHSLADMPFEIIEIGAVKVDENFNISDEWHRMIHPQVYTQLQYKVREILGISEEALSEGVAFEEACRDFLKWCGKDYTFVTWGSSDLTELQRNMKHFGVEYSFPKPFLYYDLQKLYSIAYDDGKSRINLKNAITKMEIAENEEYHSAITDARYTAKVLCEMGNEGTFTRVKRFVSVDTYEIPRSRREEIFLNFGNYSKYISKGFENREIAVCDRVVRSCKCFICGRTMNREIKWFSTNSKMYYGLFSCEEHGLIKGRFRSKQADNGLYYVVKILKRTDNDGAEIIRRRQEKERENRRKRRGRAEGSTAGE